MWKFARWCCYFHFLTGIRDDDVDRKPERYVRRQFKTPSNAHIYELCLKTKTGWWSYGIMHASVNCASRSCTPPCSILTLIEYVAIKPDIPRVPSASHLHANAKATTLHWIWRGRIIEFHGPHAWLKITRHAPPHPPPTPHSPSGISSDAAAHSSKFLLSHANTLSFKLIYPSFRVSNGDRCDTNPRTHTQTHIKKNMRWKINQERRGNQVERIHSLLKRTCCFQGKKNEETRNWRRLLFSSSFSSLRFRPFILSSPGSLQKCSK